MKARVGFALMVGLYLLSLTVPASAQKLKLGSAVKVNPIFFLTVLAAEEKGFWRENGLEVQWVPFDAGPPMYRAVVAGELQIGLDLGMNPILSSSRGLPVKMISELDRFEGIFLYVPAKSPMRQPKDLRGARLAVTTLGSATHAYAQVVTKALGLEKDVKIVAAGGIVPSVAALKAGVVDGTVIAFIALAELKVKGEVRELLSVDDYLPKPWLSRVVWAHKDYIKEKPDTLRKAARAILQSTSFWKKDSDWAIAKIKATINVSEEGARELHKLSQPSPDGRIDRKAVENARAFMIEYGIITKEKAPPVEELYINLL